MSDVKLNLDPENMMPINPDDRLLTHVQFKLVRERAKVARLREACERLLIGLNENENPDSCGLSSKEWDEEISFARAALEETK